VNALVIFSKPCMQRRRGLVSQASKSTAPIKKVMRAVSDASSAGESESEDDLAEDKHVSSKPDMDSEKLLPESSDTVLDPSGNPPDASDAPKTDGQPPARKAKKPKKGELDYSDETRFKKMRIKGVDREILVDMTRVQKYVDYDSIGVRSLQADINSAKGNYRAQTMADYSDL
jgi:hypothetical protein